MKEALMAKQIERVVDAHVHLWDPARTDWYPYLSGAQDVGLGDGTKKAHYFDQEAYFAESAKWKVDKFVHVAATASFFVNETMELDEQAKATGHPDAIIGGIVSGRSMATAIKQRDLVFDMMPHADQLAAAAMALEDWGELTIVVEHTGWPRRNTAEEYQ